MAATLTPTEIAFTLPRGYAAPDGRVHREGSMRLARARDEFEVLRHPQARRDDAYITVLLLARVVTRLGSVTVTPEVIEELFAQDFEHLVRLFEQINSDDPVGVVGCPHCGQPFEVDLTGIEDRSLGK
jgi:hypothetical protein